MSPVTEGNNTNRASVGRTPVDTATYEFEHSMWDAALLAAGAAHGRFVVDAMQLFLGHGRISDSDP